MTFAPAASPHGPGERVPLRPYLITGILLVALPILGYLGANWYATHKKAAEDCFRRPLREYRWPDEPVTVRDLYPLQGPSCALLHYQRTNRLTLLDLKSGRERELPPGAAESPGAVDLSPDGRRLAFVSRKEPALVVWDLEADQELRRFALPQNEERYHLMVSPDGRLAYLASRGRDLARYEAGVCRVLSLEDGRILAEFPGFGEERRGYFFGFTPDGASLAFADSDDRVRLVGLPDCQKTITLPIENATGSTSAFSPDGRLLAAEQSLKDAEEAPQRSEIVLWDTRTGQEVRRLAGHTDLIYDILFTRDGRRLISSGGDALIRVWDVRTGREILKLPGYEGSSCLAVSPDGRWLFSWGIEMTNLNVRFWDLERGRLVRELCLPKPRADVDDWYVSRVEFLPDRRTVVTLVTLENFDANSAEEERSEIYLWRLPDRIGVWLLGSQSATPVPVDEEGYVLQPGSGR